jgi:predicted PurR-regulated permease PerM
VTDTPWSPRTKTVVITIILLGIVLLVIVLNPLLYALLIAALLAYLLNPLVKLLMRRTRLTRPGGAGLVFVIFILLLASIPAALGTVAVGQFQRIKTDLMGARTLLESWIAQPIVILGFRLYPPLMLDNLEQIAGSVLSTLPEGSFNLLSAVTTNLLWGLVVLISLYYFLKDGPKIKLWLVGYTPVEYQGDLERLLDEIDEVWRVFLRVQLLIFVVLAALMGSGTFLVIWLFRSGLLGFSFLGMILLLILVYAAAQQVDNLWLRPQLMGRHLQLHPGLVFAGLTAGLVVGGILGALLIVPLMATVRVIGRYTYCKLLDLPPWPQEVHIETLDTESKEDVSRNGEM